MRARYQCRCPRANGFFLPQMSAANTQMLHRRLRVRSAYGCGKLSDNREPVKKIHGAVASACRMLRPLRRWLSLLPDCRSWREHRPVYGPSLKLLYNSPQILDAWRACKICAVSMQLSPLSLKSNTVQHPLAFRSACIAPDAFRLVTERSMVSSTMDRVSCLKPRRRKREHFARGHRLIAIASS